MKKLIILLLFPVISFSQDINYEKEIAYTSKCKDTLFIRSDSFELLSMSWYEPVEYEEKPVFVNVPLLEFYAKREEYLKRYE